MGEKKIGCSNAEEAEANTVEEKKEKVLSVRDSTDDLRELTGLIKENYLTSR
jgi:hypothetical protein